MQRFNPCPRKIPSLLGERVRVRGIVSNEIPLQRIVELAKTAKAPPRRDLTDKLSYSGSTLSTSTEVI
jgi:hypothetical protein